MNDHLECCVFYKYSKYTIVSDIVEEQIQQRDKYLIV